MLGVILAGGRATRLGPLAAQLNKSLVTVGSKPMLVRQTQQLLGLGCIHVRVVVSPGAEDQVTNVLQRCGLDSRVTTIIQETALGPGDAVRCGLKNTGSYEEVEADEEVVVLTADTLLIDEELPREADLVAAARPPDTSRPWCVLANPYWIDSYADEQSLVAVGAYRFKNAADLYVAAAFTKPGFANEVQLSGVMNEYTKNTGRRMSAYLVTSWQDVGDVPALARANRKHFIAREFNGIEMIEPGILRKTGDEKLIPEMRFIEDLPRDVKHLFPRVIRSGVPIGEDVRPWYDMEYVDSPSLAELWLYWPAVPEMWSHVASELVEQLTKLWTCQPSGFSQLLGELLGGEVARNAELKSRAGAMYVGKLLHRYVYVDSPSHLPSDSRDVVRHAVKVFNDAFIPEAKHYRGVLHGDPTFANVMWSLKTGSFKLLDPRGDWGGDGPFGDVRYDVGKIAASPWMAPIMHDLYDDDGILGFSWNRTADVAALHKPLLKYFAGNNQLMLMVAYHLLSSAPLHVGPQGAQLYRYGVDLLERFEPR